MPVVPAEIMLAKMFANGLVILVAAMLSLQFVDAGKKIKGRKRHILVDTMGLLLNVVVHSADIQGRDGAVDLLCRARRRT